MLYVVIRAQNHSTARIRRGNNSIYNNAEEDRLDLYKTAMKRLGQQSTEAVKKKPSDQKPPPRQRQHQAAAMDVDQPPCLQDEDNRNTTGTCRTVPVSLLGSAVQRLSLIHI